MSDHYSTLGVDPAVSQDQIKKAYRKLSLQHHPDKSNGKSDVFQKINEAYQVLGDAESRSLYDSKRQNPFMNTMGGDDLLNMFFGGMRGMPPVFGFGQSVPGGPNIHVFRNGMQVPVNQFRKPVPIVKTIEITLAQAYNGITYPLEIERWVREDNTKKMEREKIYVSINQGVDDGEIMILRGQGNVVDERNKGDVKIFIKVTNDTQFVRNGLDLVYHKQLTLKEALTGFSFAIRHLSGNTYTINNTNGRIINTGYQKSIPDMGMKRVKPHPAPVMVGDLIVCFSIKFPTSLTEEQREVLRDVL